MFVAGNQHYLPFRVSQYGNVLVATPLAYVSNSVVKGSPNSNVFTFGVTVRNTAYPFLKTSVMVTLNVTEAGNTQYMLPYSVLYVCHIMKAK